MMLPLAALKGMRSKSIFGSGFLVYGDFIRMDDSFVRMSQCSKRLHIGDSFLQNRYASLLFV